jgi:hypothetical protein
VALLDDPDSEPALQDSPVRFWIAFLMDSIIPPIPAVPSMFNITENSGFGLIIFGLMNQDSSGVIDIIFSLRSLRRVFCVFCVFCAPVTASRNSSAARKCRKFLAAERNTEISRRY